jgi:hypothetical protein
MPFKLIALVLPLSNGGMLGSDASSPPTDS